MDDDFSDRFWRRVCTYRKFYPGVFALSVTLLIGTVVSISVVEPGSATYYVAVADVGLMLVVGAVTAALIVGCRRQRKNPYEDRE